MKKYIKFIFFIFLFTITFLPKNLEAKENTINEKIIIELLLNKNAKLKANNKKSDIYNAEIINSKLFYNPNMLFDFSLPQNTYRLGVTNTLEIGDKRNLRVSLAEEKKKLADISLLYDIRNLKIKALKEFYKIIYLRNLKEKYNNLLVISQNILDLTDKKFKAGDIPKLDRDNIEIKNIILNNQLIKNDYELLLSENILSELIRTNVKNLKFDDSALDNCNIEKLVKLKNRSVNKLEILELNQKLETFAKQKELAIENIKPNFNISYGLDTTTEKLLSNGVLNSGPFVALSFELNTYNKNQGLIYEIDANKEYLEKEKAVIESFYDLELRNAKNNYFSNQILKNQYENNLLPQIKTNLEKNKISFETGKTDIFKLITANQNLIDAELEYLKIKFNYQESIIELRKLEDCI